MVKVNGEAIYDTRPWEIFGEGPAEVIEGHLSEHKNKDNTEKDIRFTTNGDTLYATVLDWPTEEIQIRTLDQDKLNIKDISLLGSSEAITWAQSEQGVSIQAPKVKVGKYAFVFKITTN
ncbi:hypothetical protein L0668_03170 [Paraglaciecola aquimarina]|uniref:Alpha-L-fucosidase C-terminal domain-containing protein n=1 Tax=Paraglaciecola algarum TaxID=3050085 RepID=A0ABS9D507_9ALTE|nr:alpha-L-fucosidase C-terminal domain-containing protein [Paraglaciecola sp. G1-23]MCF2947092.1 hypothetical protein [Paraglaciecola sp. G1-23]